MEEIKSLKVLSGLQEADEPAYTWIIHLRNYMASYAGTIIDYKEKEFIRKLIDALYVVIKDENGNQLGITKLRDIVKNGDKKPIYTQDLPKKEVGGTHYEKCGIQPIEYIHANHLNFDEGSVVKYVSRHRNKNGAEDIMKMIQYGTFILKEEYHYTNEQIKEVLSKLY